MLLSKNDFFLYNILKLWMFIWRWIFLVIKKKKIKVILSNYYGVNIVRLI